MERAIRFSLWMKLRKRIPESFLLSMPLVPRESKVDDGEFCELESDLTPIEEFMSAPIIRMSLLFFSFKHNVSESKKFVQVADGALDCGA